MPVAPVGRFSHMSGDALLTVMIRKGPCVYQEGREKLRQAHGYYQDISAPSPPPSSSRAFPYLLLGSLVPRLARSCRTFLHLGTWFLPRMPLPLSPLYHFIHLSCFARLV